MSFCVAGLLRKAIGKWWHFEMPGGCAGVGGGDYGGGGCSNGEVVVLVEAAYRPLELERVRRAMATGS